MARNGRKSEKDASVLISQGTYQRLPDSIIPDNYLICLKPNWKTFTFEGSEIVHLTIKRDVREVLVNGTDLSVFKIIWVEDVTENRQEPIGVHVVDNEVIKIIFEPPLSPSQGSLRVNFSGVISTKGSKGLYWANHNDEIGHEFCDLATNFEPINARRCFPCWDEPAFKATFDLCLILPKELVALSNTAVKVTYPHRSRLDLHVVEFMKTPIISTHMLCFCTGKFDLISGQTDNLVCHVYTEKGKRKLGQCALEFALMMIPFYNTYFSRNCPLSKLDIVGLSDTPPGGIGNSGLITLRDMNLYIDTHSSAQSTQSLSFSIAHHLVHSWFDIVTPEWFNNYWLKEGFVTFMEYLTMDHFGSQFSMWAQFIFDCYIRGLELDGSRFSRSIESPVNNMTDIPEVYENVVKYKGAALIRMLCDYVGEKHFREGITLFLKRYEFKTAKSEDLWKILEEVSGKPVDTVMHSWVKQPGYPLIKVSTKQEGNYRLFTLTQERYHQGESYRRESRTGSNNLNKELLWSIPITFSSAAKPNIVKVLMDKKTATVSILIGKTHWVHVNPGLHGFYRVRYSPDCFTQFLSAVRQRQLPILERMGVLNDLFCMCQNGQSSTVEVLSVIEAYIEETNYSVWKLIASIIQQLDLLLESTDVHTKFLAYARYIFSNVNEKTRWESKENEGHLVTLQRTVILSMMLYLNDEKAVAEALKRFELHTKGELNIPPDLRTPVYRTVLRERDEETIKAFFRMYRESDSSEEKDRIAKSFSVSVKNVEKVKMILDFAIADEVQHTNQILIALSQSKISRELTWTFFKEHWTLFRHRYSGGLLNSLVKSITENFVTEEKAVEVAEFFKEHHHVTSVGTGGGGLERTVLVACEKIRMNEAWLKRDSSFIQDYLSIYKS